MKSHQLNAVIQSMTSVRTTPSRSGSFLFILCHLFFDSGSKIKCTPTCLVILRLQSRDATARRYHDDWQVGGRGKKGVFGVDGEVSRRDLAPQSRGASGHCDRK